MALISTADQETIRTLFAQRLQDDVTITYFTQHDSSLIVPSTECAYCADTRALLEEVSALSDRLHLEVMDFLADRQQVQALGINRIPAFVLQGQAQGQVRFFGIPAGYEFGNLIESIFDVSTGKTDLSEKTRGMLETLDQDVHLQVFVTPTCPYCPQAARLAHKLAVECAYVTADVVEISEFPEMAQRYSVSGVPQTVVNEGIVFAGAVPESQLMRDLIEALKNAGPAPQPAVIAGQV